jgi:hypothetical protein
MPREDDSLGYQFDNILSSDFVNPSWFESFPTEARRSSMA